MTCNLRPEELIWSCVNHACLNQNPKHYEQTSQFADFQWNKNKLGMTGKQQTLTIVSLGDNKGSFGNNNVNNAMSYTGNNIGKT